jgi:hypothetical protein
MNRLLRCQLERLDQTRVAPTPNAFVRQPERACLAHTSAVAAILWRAVVSK